MKRIFFLIFATIFLASCSSASKLNRADQPFAYEVESVGVGADGTYAIRIWSFSKKPEITMVKPQQNAIHATLFRGIPAGGGATAQPALIPSDSQYNHDSPFFQEFFKSDYQRFVNSVAKGSVQVVKSGRREYKIGYVMSIAKDNLRRYLEEQGIIKGLSSGF